MQTAPAAPTKEVKEAAPTGYYSSVFSHLRKARELIEQARIEALSISFTDLLTLEAVEKPSADHVKLEISEILSNLTDFASLFNLRIYHYSHSPFSPPRSD